MTLDVPSRFILRRQYRNYHQHVAQPMYDPNDMSSAFLKILIDKVDSCTMSYQEAFFPV